MPELEFPHLFLPGDAQSKDYINPSGGGSDFELPNRPDREAHASRVRTALDRIWQQAKDERDQRKAVSLPARDGAYIEFESAPGFPLKFESLEERGSGIRLLNVQFVGEGEAQVQRATIYVPKGKERILLNKVERYRTENTQGGAPKNKALVESIEGLRKAIIQSFWCDRADLVPGEQAKSCEVWLRTDAGSQNSVAVFRALCATLNISVDESEISFPERTVVNIQATGAQLEELLGSSEHIAEFRLAKETADFWVGLPNAEQADWVNALVPRLSVAANTSASVCVLDTGVAGGHPLLAPILPAASCLSINAAEWGVSDSYGHGTAMCGTVTFADRLSACLQSDESVEIPFQLESVKLIQKPGDKSSGRLYGERTLMAISRSEIQNPEFNRAFCLAITSEDGRDRGRPSSWSGAIDQIVSGAEDGQRRLFIVSSGNVWEANEWASYPDSNITNSVHDPAQSWNALTVGAVTFLDEIHNAEMAKTYTPVAGKGQLSPYSTTSWLWDGGWPNKPDIVMEGGNVGVDKTEFTTELDDLCLLSLGHKPNEALLSTNWGTSAASGMAAELAGTLIAQYPSAWPETIRGLMVHSAEWTPQLWQQFSDPNKSDKYNREKMLRTCGYGVPKRTRAIQSATDSLTLIAQQSIQPFEMNEKKAFRAKDMHLFELPWPTDALRDLPGQTPVTIDITLSYFIEPGPGEIGWRDKYRYRSHGLDFNLKKPTETTEEFIARLNKAAREDDDADYGGSSIDWTIGVQKGRSRGSVHRDWVTLTAAEAVDANVVGVFPRSGWWKERSWLGRGDKDTRYSLIVSIRTQAVGVDIYTPVAVALAAAVAIGT